MNIENFWKTKQKKSLQNNKCLSENALNTLQNAFRKFPDLQDIATRSGYWRWNIHWARLNSQQFDHLKWNKIKLPIKLTKKASTFNTIEMRRIASQHKLAALSGYKWTINQNFYFCTAIHSSTFWKPNWCNMFIS